MHNTIITLSRQYGSGGRAIGKQLAENLGIPYYDRELIEMAAKESGYSEEVLKELDEKPNSLLFALSTGTYPRGTGFDYEASMPMNDRLFFLQSSIIRRLAQQGSCVIIGRCADFVLRNNPDAIRVFVQAALPVRVERAVNVYGLSPERAETTVQRIDRQRASYHNFYADYKWGKMENYNLIVDSGFVGLENAVSVIEQYVRFRAERP